MNYKDREPLPIKTSKIQENRPRLHVKRTMTSLRCDGNAGRSCGSHRITSVGRAAPNCYGRFYKSQQPVMSCSKIVDSVLFYVACTLSGGQTKGKSLSNKVVGFCWSIHTRDIKIVKRCS